MPHGTRAVAPYGRPSLDDRQSGDVELQRLGGHAVLRAVPAHPTRATARDRRPTRPGRRPVALRRRRLGHGSRALKDADALTAGGLDRQRAACDRADGVVVAAGGLDRHAVIVGGDGGDQAALRSDRPRGHGHHAQLVIAVGHERGVEVQGFAGLGHGGLAAVEEQGEVIARPRAPAAWRWA